MGLGGGGARSRAREGGRSRGETAFMERLYLWGFVWVNKFLCGYMRYESGEFVGRGKLGSKDNVDCLLSWRCTIRTQRLVFHREYQL